MFFGHCNANFLDKQSCLRWFLLFSWCIVLSEKSILLGRKHRWQGGFITMYPSIGKKIREYRKERGLTQDELAEKVNLSPNHMGAIERAEKNLTLATLINIANALDVTADMLLCDEIQNGYRIKTSMLTEKLEKLSPTDRNKILQMVDIMLGE